MHKCDFGRLSRIIRHVPAACRLHRCTPRLPFAVMPSSRRPAALFAVALLIAASAGVLSGTSTSRRRSLSDDAPPRTARSTARADAALDPIARLQQQLDAGAVTLAHDSALGYLPAVLKALHIPVSSQGLVFSRTSLRTDLIAPWSPRALYFNDDVYIGFVQGSEFLEIGAVNPNTGGVFYTLNQEPTGRPAFNRESNACLMCHKSPGTGGVPGFMVLSTIADNLGYPITPAHDGTTTDRTPIRDRFGGWYVTGTHGPHGHSGNVWSPKNFNQVDREQYRSQIDLTTESERTTLAGKFNASPYLSPQSDIVALMVLVHQTSVHNLLTSLHNAANTAVLETSTFDQYRDNVARGRPMADYHGGLRVAVERVVRAMLFADEAPMGAPMHGSTDFAREFARVGPHDAKGRTLRDLDLEQRLFRYPMSFLVYSEQFDSLPPVAKQGVYARFRTILAGRDSSAEFQRMPAADRQAVLDILAATKPDFAATFKK